MFERIAIIYSGGATTRCVRTIETMRTSRAWLRTVLVHWGSRVPGTISREIDKVTLARMRP